MFSCEFIPGVWVLEESELQVSNKAGFLLLHIASAHIVFYGQNNVHIKFVLAFTGTLKSLQGEVDYMETIILNHVEQLQHGTVCISKWTKCFHGYMRKISSLNLMAKTYFSFLLPKRCNPFKMKYKQLRLLLYNPFI